MGGCCSARLNPNLVSISAAGSRGTARVGAAVQRLGLRDPVTLGFATRPGQALPGPPLPTRATALGRDAREVVRAGTVTGRNADSEGRERPVVGGTHAAPGGGLVGSGAVPYGQATSELPPEIARYTRSMPAQTIAQSLAYINWTVLVALALGSLAFVVAIRELAPASRGYLTFSGVAAALLALLALAADLGLPPPGGLAIAEAPGLDALRRVALLALAILALAWVIVVRRRGRVWLVGLLAVGAGIAAAGIAAVGWAGGLVAAVPLLIQYLVLAAATGGALAALVLGHWYLVTPRLSERPLVLVAQALTAVVGLQVLLSIVWAAIGPGVTQPPLADVPPASVLFVGLRFVVGLLFPLVLSWMALRTARTRSMESATGLLYIDVAAIASGTIVAAALYYASGVLV